MAYYFRTEQLTVGYDGKPLVRDIDIALEKGKIMTLIGPNGSGKSTLLKTIIRQLDPVGGMVYIGKNSYDSMTNSEMARQVSVVLTQRMKTDRMTCLDVVETGRYPYTGRLGILSEADHQAVREAVELIGVEELCDQDFMRISDGQRQRVLLARAIAQDPELLVLDEPTSFLDVRYKLDLLQLLRKLAREKGLTVIMSMHELDLAERVSDQVMCVSGDHLAAFGSVREIFQSDYICSLYGLPEGSYDPIFGSLEMKGPEGKPEVFVIAGGGTGVEVFRSLARKGIPFAAGVLHENDVDARVAASLASSVITEKAFCSLSDHTIEKAKAVLLQCREIIVCIDEYGETNYKNSELEAYAEENGIRKSLKQAYVI